MNDAMSCDSAAAAEFIASPNHGERRGSAGINAIVLHYTGMPSESAALERLCATSSEVSAHYLVCESGRVIQLVAEHRRAWHAGVGVWRGERDINSVSIGIEIANAGHEGGLPPFGARQIASVIRLCRDIARRRSIPPERVLAHSDIAPGRKRDPGEMFPWARLAQAGVGLWFPPAAIPRPSGREPGDVDIRACQEMLATLGYGIEATGQLDAQTQIVLKAFQRRYRPWLIDGAPDFSTLQTLARLIRELTNDAQTIVS